MPSSASLIAKIADFGLSQSYENGLGDKTISGDQFTTLSITPPDYFFLGDQAKQGPAHDLYCVGLMIIHLYAEQAHDEIMGNVSCPEDLASALENLFKTASYSVIFGLRFYKRVERWDDVHQPLYHLLVMFGVPEQTTQPYKESPMWKTIDDAFAVKTQFDEDHKKFSLTDGTDEKIAQAREALNALPGGMELVRTLCNFDPSKRGTVKELLQSPFMKDLRESPEQTESFDSAGIKIYSVDGSEAE
jgi:serine/threonine protein kinase